MHSLRFVDDCTGGVGVAVDVQQLSHGERAEHAARSGQHRDKKRLNADAAELDVTSSSAPMRRPIKSTSA